MRVSNGKKIKDDNSVILAKNEILKEIKDDEYYEIIKNFIKEYDQLKNNSLN